MASTINASTSPAAIVQTADGTANLSLQSNGTTIAALTSTGMAVTGTLSASGVTTFAAGTAALPAITTTGDTNTGMFFPAANTVAASTGGAEAMRIDSSGNVGIGVIPSASNLATIQSTYALLSGNSQVNILQNSYYNSGFLFTGTGYATQYQQITGSHIWKVSSASGTANNAVTFNETMRIGSTGRVYIPNAYTETTGNAANLYVDTDGRLIRATSSLKYKTDVKDATHGLKEVMQLRSVTYKGKEDGEKVFGGLIAEEVHAVGLTEFVQYALDETPDALAYGNMVSLLTKAIQEQQALITSLTARITALEGA